MIQEKLGRAKLFHVEKNEPYHSLDISGQTHNLYLFVNDMIQFWQVIDTCLR